MLTLAKNPNDRLCYLLTDDPAHTQTEGLTEWKRTLADLAAARTPDETAEPGHECDRYSSLWGEVNDVMRASHEIRQCDDISPSDAAFVADVIRLFSEWIEGSEFEEAIHWRLDFSEVLSLPW